MTKKLDYTFEILKELYNQRVPKAPNFGKMIDRDHDHKSIFLPLYIINILK